MRWITWFLVGGLMLLPSAGCQSDDVARAFGYTTPGIHAEQSIFGVSIDVDSDIQGTVTIDYTTNGALHASATLNSKASAVTQAQGERIHDNFLEGRRIEWAGKEAQALAVGTNVQAFFNGAIGLTNAIGKDAAVPIIAELAGTLRGSGAAIDLGALGGGSVNIGPQAGRGPNKPPPD